MTTLPEDQINGTIPVGLMGNEGEDYVLLQDTRVFFIIRGRRCYKDLKRGLVSDGNSTLSIINIVMKRNGPHVDKGILHDGVYADPTVVDMITGETFELTRRECDYLHFYFLRHPTDILPWTFVTRAGKIKQHKCNWPAARFAWLYIRTLGWIAWRRHRKADNTWSIQKT